MKRIIFILILSLALQASAQQENFHLVKYTPPKNWKVEKHEKVNFYTKEDKAKSTYSNIIVYVEMPSKGSAQKDFDFAWQDLLSKPFTVNATPKLLPQGNVKGWALLNGSAQYQNNGITSLAMLFTFTGENKMQAIVIIANNIQNKADIEQFINSVDVMRTVNTTNSPSTSTINSQSKITNGTMPEVWMISKQKYNSSIKKSIMQVEWMALYPNGDYYPYLPDGGFIGFSEQPKNDSWGSYSKQGNKIFAKNKFQSYEFEKINTEQIKYAYSSSLWYKCKPVDGLRLDGAYTPNVSIYAKFKTINDLISPGRKEREDVIFFKKDGTFSIEGADFFGNVTYGKISSKGNGTYAINNFSLVFTYNDGRKIQVSFTGIKNANPATNPDGYIINGLTNYKLGK